MHIQLMGNGECPHMVSHKAQGMAKMDIEVSVCFLVPATCVVTSAALANFCFLESETVGHKNRIQDLPAVFQNLAGVHGEGHRGSGSPSTSQSRLKSAPLVARMARFPGKSARPTRPLPPSTCSALPSGAIRTTPRRPAYEAVT